MVNVLVICRVMKIKVVRVVLLVGFFSTTSVLLAQPLLAAHNAPQLTSINAQNALKATLCPTMAVWNVLRPVIVVYQYTSVLIVRVGTTIFSRLEVLTQEYVRSVSTRACNVKVRVVVV